MEKQELQRLKTLDVEREERVVLSLIRNFGTNDDRLSTAVFLCASAYWLQGLSTQEDLISKINKEIKEESVSLYFQGFVKKYWELICKLKDSYTNDVLKAITLFANFENLRESCLSSTGDSISKLALKLLEVKKEDTILDLGSGINSFLLNAALFTQAQKLVGVDLDWKAVMVSIVRASVAKVSINNIQGNMLSEDFSSIQADKVFSNFPFMLRFLKLKEIMQLNPKLNEYFKMAKRTVSSDWIFTTAAMLNQKKPGKTVVVMANAGLWNEADREIRQTFINSGLIEAVISLPARLLPSTAIPVTMLVLSEGNKTIKIIDASEIYTNGRRQNTLEDKDIEKILVAYKKDSAISKSISIKAFANEDYIINPQRFLAVAQNKMENAVTFGDVCCSINRGALIHSTVLDKLISTQPTDFQYVMLKDVTNGKLSKKLPYLKELDQDMDRFCIKSGDLIISKMAPFKIALADIDDGKKVLANGNLYFVDIDAERMNPIFVMLYLQSERGMIELNSLAKGVVMKSISIKDLKNVQIPDVPLAKQNKIAKEYLELCDQLVIISKQEEMINEKMQNLVQEVF